MMKWFLALFLFLSPALASGSELCKPMGGACREACGEDEYKEIGAFDDCGEKEECCVRKTPPRQPEKKADDKGGQKEGIPAGSVCP